MPFLEARLSDSVTRGSRGGPTMPARTKTYAASGRLQQNFTGSTRLHKYDYGQALRRKADFEEVLACYHVVMGAPYTGFRHKDWGDYRLLATNSAVLSLGSGTWQIRRKYTFGGVTVNRAIIKPNTDCRFYSAGNVLLVATLDTTTGIGTVTGTPSYVLGTFDVPVTFVDDSMETIAISGSVGPDTELMSLPSILLEELLVP